MRKFASSLFSIVAMGWLFAGFAGGAVAGEHHRPGCSACGPIDPVTHVKTIHPVRYQTKVHDVSVTRHVHRVRNITTITRVQPIIRIHDITRVHHHTEVVVSNAYHYRTEHLIPIRTVMRSVENLYECGCRP